MYHFEKFKENLPSKEKFYSLLTGKKIVTKNIFMILKGALSGLRQFLTFESPLKMMKNVFFYFTLKACFVLMIFNSCFDNLVM